jgi:hypothetical protein
VKREWYEAKAEELLAPTRRSSDPDRAARNVLEHLERQADNAERWQASLEEYLARAVEAMQRADHARQAAGRAKAAAAKVDAERRGEAARVRKNARARERYRQRRINEPPRANKRKGMHALAIEVKPGAYRAVKSEAYRLNTSIPKLLGEILTRDIETAERPEPTARPRWRRTSAGRRANQHTRIDVASDIWEILHLDAFQRSLTVARRIGMAVERWAGEQPGGEPSQ